MIQIILIQNILIVLEMVECFPLPRATADKSTHYLLTVGVDNDHVLLIAHCQLSTSGAIHLVPNELRCIKLMFPAEANWGSYSIPAMTTYDFNTLHLKVFTRFVPRKSPVFPARPGPMKRVPSVRASL